jgi:hypothetical protein
MKLAVIAALILFPVCAAADSYPPSHNCRKPYKLYKFETQFELDTFNSDVARYKRCISDFVEEQDEEIEIHRRSAADAIDEWNRYVKIELRYPRA